MKKFNYLFLVTPLLFLMLIIAIQRVEDAKPKIIIRFDDYGVWCNNDWLQIEEEVIKLHEKYDVKLTYAVIPESKYPLSRHILSPQSYPVIVEGNDKNPYPLTEGSRRVEILKESTNKGITEVALHGYYHPKGYKNASKNTEFYGIPYDEQFRKLHNGKLLLDSLFNTNVTTFIPPHNTYDNLTLDLMQEFGFTCISAKQHSFDAPMDERLSLYYLWQTSDNISTVENLLKNKHFKNEPTHVLALHHTNFTTDGVIDRNKLHLYEEFLNFIRDNSIPNYTFSNFPKVELSNNELYYKVLYRYLYNKTDGRFMAKVLSFSNIISVKLCVILFYLAIMLSISGIVLTLLHFFKPSKIVGVLAILFSILLIVLIATMLYRSYIISPYNVFYILLSRRFAVSFLILSLTLPIIFSKTKR